VSHTLTKHILKLLVSGKVQKAYSLEMDEFVVILSEIIEVLLARISDKTKRGRADPCRELGLGLRQTMTRRGVRLSKFTSSLLVLSL
jgi:hypothetical protein